MASLNRVLIIGNCTRDPEMRYLPSGTPLCEISLAINRVYQGEDGEKKEECTYVDCTMWSRQAEIANQYLKRGSPVFIEGRLQYSTWEKDGQKHSKLSVVGERLQLLGSKPPSEEEGAAPPQTPPRVRESIDRMRQAVSGAPGAGRPDPDDIPF